MILLQIELSPVDFVSKVIVMLSQDILHSVGKVFHIINPCTMDCQWVQKPSTSLWYSDHWLGQRNNADILTHSPPVMIVVDQVYTLCQW